jgi:hypothetical protein
MHHEASVEVTVGTRARPPTDRLWSLLGASYYTWLRQLMPLALIAGAVWIPAQLLQLAAALALGVPGRLTDLQGLATRLARSPAPTLSGADSDLLARAGAALAAYVAVSLLVWLVALAIAQGALITASLEGLAGRPVNVRAALAAGWRCAPQMIRLWLAIAGILLAAEVVVLLAGLLLLFLAGAVAPSGVVVMLSVALLLAALIAPLGLFALLSAAAPALVVEGTGAAASVRRSFDLVRPRFGTAAGLLAVLSLTAWVAASLLSLPVQLLGGSGPGAQMVANTAAAIVGAALFAALPQMGFTALYRSLSGRGHR